jgi:hypothetical protein
MYHSNQCSNVIWNTACFGSASDAKDRMGLPRPILFQLFHWLPAFINHIRHTPRSGTESLRRCARLECLRSRLKNSCVLSCGYMCYEKLEVLCSFCIKFGWLHPLISQLCLGMGVLLKEETFSLDHLIRPIQRRLRNR